MSLLQSRRMQTLVLVAGKVGICRRKRSCWRLRGLVVDAGGFELVVLLIKVLIKLVAVDECRVRLLELVAIEIDEDGFEVINKLIYPREM